ncbi:MAG: DUF3592 domain-containing protein [Phycisphaeraceae bacterium]
MARIHFGGRRSGAITLASCIGVTLFMAIFFAAGAFFAVVLVMAYLNPENEDGPVILLFLAIPLLFMALGVGVPWFTWRKYRRKLRGEETAIAAEAPTPRKRKLGTLGLVGFFSIFFIAGAAFFYFIFLAPVMNIMAAKEWVATPCVIERSELESHRDSEGDTTYSIEMTYRYEYGGRSYRGDRYWFVRGSSSNYSGRKAIVDAHAPGTETTCYVDPDHPSQAVIERGFPNELWFGLFPLLFVLVGLGGMIGVPVYQWRKSQRDPKRAWLPSESGALSGDTAMGETDGPVTLRPGKHRRNKLIGTIVAAVLWNAFTWGFIYLVYTDDGPWFVLLFLGLFALVGLGLVGAVGYYALALFNPTVVLTVNARRLHVGQPLELQWRIEGAASRFQTLRITLEGQEEATYQRGTNTHTDKATVAEFPVTGALDRSAIDARQGRGHLQIPRDTMHSFASDRNKIVWKLHVRGDIPRWPDVSDTYDLTLLPQRVDT